MAYKTDSETSCEYMENSWGKLTLVYVCLLAYLLAGTDHWNWPLYYNVNFRWAHLSILQKLDGHVQSRQDMMSHWMSTSMLFAKFRPYKFTLIRYLVFPIMVLLIDDTITLDQCTLQEVSFKVKVLYSGKLSRENIFTENWWKMRFLQMSISSLSLW